MLGIEHVDPRTDDLVPLDRRDVVAEEVDPVTADHGDALELTVRFERREFPDGRPGTGGIVHRGSRKLIQQRADSLGHFRPRSPLDAVPGDDRGLRCSRREFDQVASLRVEGVSISATARVTGHSRTTIARWLERAATAAACFNHRLLRDFDVIELQADERCTFIGSKRRTLWLFATIEVCSRLWAGSVLGRRSHRNTKAAINDVILRGRLVGCPLIATDGFEYYVGVMVRLLGSACVYGQALKTRRNNRVVRVERRVKIGTASRLNAALLASEDSETLNTSFIERLNLTIRQGSAYLRRRSPCHARGADQLRGHVALLRCYYHFIRPHRALRFGRETRTPAMQAGLVSQRLALRDIFTAGGLTRRIFVAVVHVSVTVQPTESDEAELSTRCSPSARRQAA